MKLGFPYPRNRSGVRLPPGYTGLAKEASNEPSDSYHMAVA